MPPKTRQRRNQGEVSVHTEHSHAESAVNVQGQDQQQPPPSNQNQEVAPTSLLLQLIQSLQQNQRELAEAIKQLKEKRMLLQRLLLRMRKRIKKSPIKTQVHKIRKLPL